MANKGYKSYVFRIYPNKEQETFFAKTFGCVRFIYNKMLEDKISYYKETKQMLYNTPAQYKNKFEWLKEIDSLALSNAQMNLQKAYNNFFRDPKIGFPKYKSKKNSKMTYTTNNHKNTIYIDNGRLKLPKMDLIKIKQHRNIPDNYVIKSATITKKPSKKYYVSIMFEYEEEIPNIILNKDNAIGLDYSSHSFYVDNQNVEADYPKFYRKTQNKLAKQQRRMSHMKYGSNNYNKQKRKVAKIHEHIANQRKDWIHKLSTTLANTYDFICIEDINLRNMSKSFYLGKSTHDNGFGIFRDLLSYKMYDRGKMLVRIDKWFPSSKMCRFCGTINKELKLSDRIWTCVCGQVLNRDENAAINILNEGLRFI